MDDGAKLTKCGRERGGHANWSVSLKDANVYVKEPAPATAWYTIKIKLRHGMRRYFTLKFNQLQSSAMTLEQFIRPCLVMLILLCWLRSTKTQSSSRIQPSHLTAQQQKHATC